MCVLGGNVQQREGHDTPCMSDPDESDPDRIGLNFLDLIVSV